MARNSDCSQSLGSSATGRSVYVMGVDVSLTALGMVVLTEGRAVRRLLCETKPLNQAPKFLKDGGVHPKTGVLFGSLEERIEFTRRRVMRVWRRYQPIITLFEGYSFASKGQGQRDRAELTGVLKNSVHRRGGLIPDSIAPRALKEWATGDGTADKDMMIEAACKAGFKTDNDNTADAFWLATWAWDRTLGLLEPA